MIDIVNSIGQLDRCLSELKIMALEAVAGVRDEADTQTIKHHAEDCVGLGNHVLGILSGAEPKKKVEVTNHMCPIHNINLVVVSGVEGQVCPLCEFKFKFVRSGVKE